MKLMTWIGLLLILLGLIFITLPILGQYVSLKNIPNWLIYTYRKNGFLFITSPILIVLSILLILINLLLK